MSCFKITSCLLITLLVASSCAWAEEEVDLSNHPNLPLLPGVDECGSFSYSAEEATDLVLNDGLLHNATIGTFPMVALLGYEDSGKIKYKCLGALISKRHVVTTFECISKYKGGLPVEVRLGYVNASDETNCYKDLCKAPQDIEVADVRIREDRRLLYRNDIVLLRLASDAQFNEFVRPACLPLGSQLGRNLYEETVYGFTWKEERTYPSPIPYARSEAAFVSYDGGSMRAGAPGLPGMPGPPSPVGLPIEQPAIEEPQPCTSRRCRRRRDTGLLQYGADIVVEDLDCRNEMTFGAKCDDCQYSLESTICVEVEETKESCNRDPGSPLVYAVPPLEDIPTGSTDKQITFYLAGLFQTQLACYRTRVVAATCVASQLKWILENLSYCNQP